MHGAAAVAGVETCFDFSNQYVYVFAVHCHSVSVK
jgi:hypothetical protein